ncbi:MAG: hypothetical protein Q7I97_02570 [Thermovirgaceae bacterium]|nr:hypothetical protein [Thermovirgaceae bacterium]
MGAREKIAFLNGLLEGLSPKGEAEKKIYAGILEALGALADEIDEHSEILDEQQEFMEDLSEYCEQLEEDMDRLEGDFGDLEEYPEDDQDGTFDSRECPECGHVFFFRPEASEEDGALQCPECGFVIQD